MQDAEDCNMQEEVILPSHNDATGLANDFGQFFCQKIIHIRSSFDTNLVCETVLQSLCCDPAELSTHISLWSEFKSLSEKDVQELINCSKKKSCVLDSIPTSLLIDCLDVMLPVITKIINTSLQSGYFPDLWKNAVVNPLLKKAGLDPVFKNYRPVSNLQFISKLTESAAANQLQEHMSSNGLFPLLQSAYRKNHSTETAQLLKVKNDLLMNMNKGHVSLFVLLDLSAAFDTVDHEILIHRLQTEFGLGGVVLLWFVSYATGIDHSEFRLMA